MVRLSGKGRPLKGAVVSGAAVAVVVSFGLLLTLIELFYDRGEIDVQIGLIVVWACVFLAWAGWAAVFYLTWRRDATRYAELGRLARRLTAGTILEMIVAAPVFAFVDDPDNCYCARGSFWGLIFGATCLSWAFGPGVVLLFLYERHRWLTAAHLCRSCGYDLRGTRAAGRTSCPECGAVAK